MAKKQLKKRIFVPTGNDLGEFTIFDLQPVDVTFVDSDDNSKQSSSGDSKMGGSNSSIPDPVDNNPLGKSNSDNSNGSQGSSGGKDANPYASSSENKPNDEFSKQDRDLDNDLYGEDLDTDREEQGNNNNSDGEGGSSGDNGSGESGGSSGGMTSEDNSYAPPNYDGSSNMGDDSSSLDSTSEMEDALNKEQENMSDTAKERASEVSGEGSQSSTSQTEDNSNQQSGDKSQNGGQSQLGDNSQQGGSSQSGDSSDSQGGEGSQSQDSQAGSGSRGDKAEKGNKPNDDFKKAHDTKGNDLDDTDGKGVVDKIVREAAKRMQEELDKDETLANTNQQSLDNYKDFGAATMTTLFKGNSMVADWKAKLEKLFRKALGQRITMNPNMINKRIEDAPPGREDIETQMVKVAVLIDCSGSMGSGAFKKVIMQMDAMIKADKQMRNVLFYIIPFEAWSAAECVKRMVKCKGTKLKAELMKFKAEGGTDIVPGVHAMMKKVKNPDSIIILSDCVVTASRTVSDPTYQKWLKKYRDRIIWVLTSKRDISYMSAIDSYAKKQDRYVVFKGNGD
nr:MAG TPA: hypothetical protein [Bacteriophage sp.]